MPTEIVNPESARVQRVREAALRLLADAEGRVPRRARPGARRRGAARVKARHRRDRGVDGDEAGRHTLGHGARPLARADRRDAPLARPVPLHDIPLGRRELRGHEQHGAAAQGGPQAEGEEGPGERATRHSDRRAHAAFLALPQDVRDGCWGTGAVEGRAGDSACLPTPCSRPARFQLALLMPAQTSAEATRCLLTLRGLLGEEGMRRVFGCVITDNGSEFADEAALAAALGERPGETRLFYCDPMRSDQKGACERNHVEVRKLLPKGRGISFDRLEPAGCAPPVSQVSSEPRGSLAFMAPAQMLLAALGDDARALMEGLGVELLGPSELDLTPGASSAPGRRGARGRWRASPRRGNRTRAEGARCADLWKGAVGQARCTKVGNQPFFLPRSNHFYK